MKDDRVVSRYNGPVFEECGCKNYLRAQQAQDYYSKLFGVWPNLLVRGNFSDEEGYSLTTRGEWVQVRVRTANFHASDGTVIYMTREGFDFRLEGDRHEYDYASD